MVGTVGWANVVCGCRLCAKGLDGTAAGDKQSDVRVPGDLPYYTAALLPSSQPHWGTQIGSGVTVTYSFMTAAPSYADSEDSAGFAAMSSAQQAAVRLALAAYTAVSGLRFEEVSDIGSGGSIRFGTNTQPSSSGYAYYPAASDTGGDVYIANNVSYNTSPAVGNDGYAVILHEIGHAVGLKHPGNYNAGGGGAESPYLPSGEDNTANTVMSYTDTVTAEDLQPFDIAAVQYLYGVNTTARIGNDTYTFNMTGGVTPLVWDGGGTDTLSGAGQTSGVTLDLRQGGWSWIGTKGSSILTAGNLSINYGTVIENAIGGSGADSLIGNDADNLFDGGAGADTIEGSNGNDTVTYAASGTAVNVSLATGAGLGGDAAGDLLANVETLIGSAHNDTLGGSASVNRLEGGDGTDTVSYASSTAAVEVRLDLGTASGGYAASDTLVSIEYLIGSAYDDVLAGTTNGNQLSGNAGNDLLYGQGGADVFDGGGGFDTAVIGGTGGTVQCTGIESVLGTTGNDFVTLGSSGNTVTLSAVETVLGGAGGDWITLSNTGSRLILAAVETLVGGANSDWLDLGNRGNTLVLAAVETLIGGANSDLVTLGGRGNTLILAAVETLVGGANSDVVTLGDRGGTLLLGQIETLTGGRGADHVILGSAGSTLLVSGVETLTGGSGTDRISLAGTGATLTVSSIEELTATGGGDWINFGPRGSTLIVTGAETLVGAAGYDLVTLGGTGGSIVIAGLDALIGTEGADLVRLGDRGNTMIIRGVETVTGGVGRDVLSFDVQSIMAIRDVDGLIGSAGNDVVTLMGTGYTISIAAVETLSGTAGGDWINLGNRGSTMQVTGVETLIGGANSDVVILGDLGTTMVLTAIETLVGSVGTDWIRLGDRGNTLLLSNVETLTGGNAIDDVTVSGPTRFQGGGGSDVVRLQAAGNVDSLVFASLDDGGASGDTVTNFTSTTDRLLMTGALRLAVDRNTNGQLTAVERGTGQTVLASDELVALSATVSSLRDTDFASFRQALGTLAAGTSTGTSLVIASDGTNSALYAVSDNGDGRIAAGEVRLLAYTSQSRLATGDIALG